MIDKKFLGQNIFDRHKGKPAFVLGTGPSLRNLDPEVAKSFIVIAVNCAIQKFQNADYFFTCDSMLPFFEYWYILRDLNCKIVLYNIGGDEGCFGHIEESKIERDIWEGIDRDRIRFFLYHNQDFIMDKNSYDLIQGSSSIHPAVHLAYVMGCSPIILCGCDCRYVDGMGRYYNVKHIKHPYLDGYEERRLKTVVSTDEVLRSHALCWKKIRNQNPDIDIIDTSGGELTMFPQMTIEEAIDKYGVK